MTPPTVILPRLGIDVSKATFDAHLCLLDNSVHTAEFTNDTAGFATLDAWLKKHAASKTRAGLEATGSYSQALLEHLYKRGHAAHQLNPRHVKNHAGSLGRRVKTDRTDAAVIASFLKSREDLHPWQPPAQALVDLQALVRRRTQVLDMLQAERNRKEASASKAVAASLKRQMNQLLSEVKALDAAIGKLVLENAQVQKHVLLLCSIPGVGIQTATTLLAEVPHLLTFSRARDLAAFVGLTPALAQSGTSVRRRGCMTKQGSTLLRKMLYMAALQAVKRTTNAFHKTYKAFVDRGKAKLLAIGAIMHKILRICFGVLKHETNFVANFAQA